MVLSILTIEVFCSNLIQNVCLESQYILLLSFSDMPWQMVELCTHNYIAVGRETFEGPQQRCALYKPLGLA